MKGSKLLQHIIDEASKTLSSTDPIVSIFMHVETSNEIAKDFYMKRGFVLQETVPGYYKYRSSPSKDAWLFRYDVISK